MTGQLRVAVIGSETRHRDNPPLTYTVYRTSVNYHGVCYHRLIRFRQFRSFAKRLKLASNATRITVKFPSRIWWSRKTSLQPETVEARQVLLNEFMQQVTTRPLTPRSAKDLLKLLQVGPFAPEEEEDRVINSRVSLKQRSIALTDPMSEMLDPNHSLRFEANYQLPVNGEKKQPHDSSTDEEEDANTAAREQNVPRHSLCVKRQGFDTCSNPQSDGDTETPAAHSLSGPPTPLDEERTRPTSMSLTSQNMKRVMFGSSAEPDLMASKDEGKDSVGTLADVASSPESHYAGRIKQCIASIEEAVDSSRKFEIQVYEKQMADKRREQGHLKMEA